MSMSYLRLRICEWLNFNTSLRKGETQTLEHCFLSPAGVARGLKTSTCSQMNLTLWSQSRCYCPRRRPRDKQTRWRLFLSVHCDTRCLIPRTNTSVSLSVQTLPDASTSAPVRSTAQDPSANQPDAPDRPVCILADSRCISSGVELMTCLRQRHAATVHVCSLDATYFIVSNRTAVERHSQSDLASMQNRKKLTERVKSLQGLFERVCLIVEKDRTKPGQSDPPGSTWFRSIHKSHVRMLLGGDWRYSLHINCIDYWIHSLTINCFPPSQSLKLQRHE